MLHRLHPALIIHDKLVNIVVNSIIVEHQIELICFCYPSFCPDKEKYLFSTNKEINSSCFESLNCSI